MKTDFEKFIEVADFTRSKYAIRSGEAQGSTILYIQDKKVMILCFDDEGNQVDRKTIPKTMSLEKAKLYFYPDLSFLDYKYQDNFRVGDTVRLTAKSRKNHVCPEGRENNKTAKIQIFLPEIDEGAFKTDKDLRGCQYWNIKDAELVKSA